MPRTTTIVSFRPEFAAAFADLNRAWIERFFTLEDADTRVLRDPQAAIIARGGQVLFAVHDGRPVGTVAAIRLDDTSCELAKMAVDPAHQGLGIGEALGRAILAWARDHGCTRMVLETNSALEGAIRLYRRLGFVHATAPQASDYARADVYMTLDLTLDLSGLPATTQAVYERQAVRFDAERPKRLHERAWLDRFLALVAPGGTILDLGCGAGDPIAAYLTAAGHRVIGVDASRAMLDIARARTPDGDWRHGDMRDVNLPERFDGIIAWNSFFHLTRDEQRAVLPRLIAHLAPRGALMLTVGPADGEVAGRVGGEPIYHSSLAPGEYRRRLADLGVEVVQFVAEDPECDGQTVLLARRQES